MYIEGDSMIDVYFYKNSAEPIRLVKDSFLEPIDKDPNGEAIPYECNLKDSTDVLNPTLLMSFDVATTPIINSNYAYIPAFKRYYYIRNMNSVRTNLWSIALHVDVLMSHRDAIANIECICTRNRDVYNSYLVDDRVPLQSNYNVQYVVDMNSPLIPVDATGSSSMVYCISVIRGEAQQ